MRILAITLLVFAIYFNVLLFYGLFYNNNDTVNMNAVISSVTVVNDVNFIRYSYSYKDKMYVGSENTDKDVKVGDLYPIKINKDNGEVSSSILDVLDDYLLTILVFLSVLFYGLSYYVNKY